MRWLQEVKPTARSHWRLEEASRLRQETLPWRYEAGTLSLEVCMPPHAVAALTVEFADGESLR